MPDTNIMTTKTLHAGSAAPEQTIARPSLPNALLQLGLSRAAVSFAAGEVELVGRELRARHRGPDGCHLGWERIVPPGTPGARVRYLYQGACKGLFRTPPGRCGRLVLTDGPLPSLLRLSEDLAVGRGLETCYAAPGGNWTSTASAALHALLARGRVHVVELDFGPHASGRTSEARVRAIVAQHAAVALTWRSQGDEA